MQAAVERLLGAPVGSMPVIDNGTLIAWLTDKRITLWEKTNEEYSRPHCIYYSADSIHPASHYWGRLGANAAEGSVIVADIYAKSFVTGEYARGIKATLPVLDMTDEGLGFGIEMAGDYQHTLESFVSSEGLTLGETYFMGRKTKKGPWMVVVELKV